MTPRLRLPSLSAACVAAALALVADQRPAVRAGEPRLDSIQILRRVAEPDRAVAVIRFDHATGRASQLVVDEASGRILREHTWPGRPQSSPAEVTEAVRIIGRDRTLAGLVEAGAVAEGGFIVDGPAGFPPRHRYIQIRLLSPDRRDLLRVTVVDLTAGVVASARPWFE